MSIEELLKEWFENIYDNHENVDPNSDQDWHSMAMGYALGKGFSPDRAREFAWKSWRKK